MRSSDWSSDVCSSDLCLLQRKPKTLAITVDGELGPGVTAKDLILHVIGTIGVNGGTGHVIEYRGSTIAALSMAQRMTVRNMSIEAGARAGLIAPAAAHLEYLGLGSRCGRGRGVPLGSHAVVTPT